MHISVQYIFVCQGMCMYKLPSSQPCLVWQWYATGNSSDSGRSDMHDGKIAGWKMNDVPFGMDVAFDVFMFLFLLLLARTMWSKAKHSYWSWEFIYKENIVWVQGNVLWIWMPWRSRQRCLAWNWWHAVCGSITVYLLLFQDVKESYNLIFQMCNLVLPHQGLWCTPEIVGVPDGAVELLMNSVLIGVKMDMHCIDEMVYIMLLCVVKETCFDMWYILIVLRFYCHGLWYQHQEMRVG